MTDRVKLKVDSLKPVEREEQLMVSHEVWLQVDSTTHEPIWWLVDQCVKAVVRHGGRER